MNNWDVFCKIVDNFGDIGVCWRLSQQLANEHQLNVRLFIDDFSIASHIIPNLDSRKLAQTIHGVEIHAWPTDHVVLPNVVIENFSCELPAVYTKQISIHNKQCQPAQQVVWINLEYLSAEQWVEDCHTLPSIHPTLGYTRHFFYPGFTNKTGGLLRESDLLKTRGYFQDTKIRHDFLNHCLGSSTLITDPSKVISLFCYPQANIDQLIDGLANINQDTHLLLPFNSEIIAIQSVIEQYQLRIGHSQQIKHLTLHVLPFLSQSDYDQLLWACDLNFVRGEDSWIRAIWSGQPFIWQPYIQTENTHIKKLDAFLSHYLADNPSESPIIQQAHHVWSNAVTEPNAQFWENVLTKLSNWQKHSQQYAKNMAKQADLCAQLVTFALQIHNKHKKRNSV